MLGDYERHDDDHAWHRLERGEITAEEFWNDLVARAEAEGHPIDLADTLRSFAGGIAVHDDMLTFARSLRPAYKTAVLTNNVKEYAGAWREWIDADGSFDVIVDSSELGMRKPEPRIFAYACAALGVDAGDCVFLDDHPANVAAARDAGLVAIHVDDHDSALAELRAALGERDL